MNRPVAARFFAFALGTVLVLDGTGVTSAQTVPAPVSAEDALKAPAAEPAAPPPATPEAAPTPAPAKQPASVSSVKKTTAKRTTARRRRSRGSRAVRLPAVTPYGIPRLHVKAAYVVDANNRVLFQKNPERVLPIASLTKLMTAMVFLQTDPDWDRVVEVTVDDVRNSSRTRIRPREEITVRDLFHASLMSSDNCATKTLVRTSGIPQPEFIRRMNTMADSLGLAGTSFVEPTGLSEQNVSTAQDMARILRLASGRPEIAAITQKVDYEFTSNRKRHHLVNTNRLLRSQWEVTGGKTGFIREAGYCLVTNVKSPTGLDITAVVLGAPSNTLRFAEARRILDWTFRFGLPRAETLPPDNN
jgi:D-alanyl-D-alanine endopeptidase (penicillin-binding protein 7)